MKSSILSLAVVGLIASAPLFLSSCQDEELGYTAKQISYLSNFEKTFGKINSDQNWDLYYSSPRTAKYEAPDVRTRAISGYTDATDEELKSLIASRPGHFNSMSDNDLTGWYDVQSTTIQWLNEQLVEGQNNTNKGEPFALVKPTNNFAIIPIYQGEAGMDWSLHLVDKGDASHPGKDYNLWTESQGIIMSNDNSNWEKPGTEWGNSQTIGKSYIKSQPIVIDYTKLNGEFFLYLDITNGQDGYAATGTKQRSDEGMMLSLSCPIPTNLDNFTTEENSMIMLVGCEDANGPRSDWDINDVVFIIVGYPLIPDVVEYTHKRYMFEDLGNTWDFDFNDVVLDVDQTAYYSASIETRDDGKKYVKRTLNESTLSQSATLKWLCGTLPVQVKVGDFSFNPISDPTEYDQTITELTATRGTPGIAPEVTKVITGWNPKTNNVSLRVSKKLGDTSSLRGYDNEPVFTDKFPSWSQDANGNVYGTDFPGPGETPLIICVSQTRDWMPEGVHIPESWWKTGDVFIDHKDTPDDPVVGGNDLPWTGEKTLQWGDGLIFPGSCFNNAQPGDMIVVSANDNVRLSYNKTSGWDAFATTNNGTHTLTQDQINSLKEHGLVITADGKNIYNVKLVTPVYYTLTTSAEHGSVNVNPQVDGGRYLADTQVTLTAVPANGYHFVKWSDDVTTMERIITMSDDVTLMPTFAEGYPETLWSGSCSVVGSGTNWVQKDITLYFAGRTPVAGDYLVFEATNANFEVVFGNWDILSKPELVGDVYKLEINQDIINKLSSNMTIKINANNVTITSVRYEVPQAIGVESVSLDRTSATIELGGSDLTLMATVSPANATDKSVNWSSSNTDVATVTNGVVHAVAKGTATITATAADGSEMTATCVIQVNATPSISLDPATKTVKVGDAGFTITPNVKNAVDNPTITWSSSNEEAATVENGLVTIVGEGTTTITAKITVEDVDYSATCSVTVNPQSNSTTLTASDLASFSNNTIPASYFQDAENKITVTVTRGGNGGIQEGINWDGEYNNAPTITFTFTGDNVATIKNNGLNFVQGYDLISTIEIECE